MAEGNAKSAPQSSAAIPKRGSVIVRNTLAALRLGKANEQRLICTREAGLVPCSIAKRSIGRVAELLPRLEMAAEIQGFTLTADDQPSRFSDGSQNVQFEISEGYNREKHKLTSKEKAERAAWE